MNPHFDAALPKSARTAAPAGAAWWLRCIGCGATSGDMPRDCRCGVCGDLFEVAYPGWTEAPERAETWRRTWKERRLSEEPMNRSGVWRFREFLPVLSAPENAVTLAEGNTPLYKLAGCARAAGLQHVWAKHQGMNPTGSFKDTGMTVAISLAREQKFSWVACASTGNTSASMSAYAARAGLRSLVLIPEGKIAWGKLAQTLDYGAVTCQLRADFDGCVRVLDALLARWPLYLVNSVNPLRLEGQKTAAIEILEQLDWEPPDHVVVPGGNLANSSALGKGFLELKQLGLIGRLPRISIVQAEGANPLVRSLRERNGTFLVRVTAETLATAIRIGNPASWKKAVQVLRETGGECIEVSEEAIALARAEIGEEGVGCEPASAAAWAGAKQLARAGFIGPEERTVVVLTGHVLKDPEYTLAYHRGTLLPAGAPMFAGHRHPPAVLEADAGEVARHLEQLGASANTGLAPEGISK